MGGQSERKQYTHTHARTTVSNQTEEESPIVLSPWMNDTNSGSRESGRGAVLPPRLSKNESQKDG